MNRRTFSQTLLGMLAVCGLGRAATKRESQQPTDDGLHTKCLTHYHIHENMPAWRAERVMENGRAKWISYQRDSNGQWFKTMESCNFPVCPCVQFKRAKA